MRKPPRPDAAAQQPARAPTYASANGDHWKKLLRPKQAPQAVSIETWTDELNRRLRADPCFREGTRFVVEGAASTWEGPESMKPIVCRIVHSVTDELEAPAPFRADR